MTKHRKPRKRDVLLGLMLAAGYHGDKATWTGLLVGQKLVSWYAANDAWKAGRAAKERGVPCNCHECKVAA